MLKVGVLDARSESVDIYVPSGGVDEEEERDGEAEEGVDFEEE